MRVLLTRPEQQSAATAARLAERGHAAVIAPLMRIVPVAADIPASGFDAVIATSAHAFTHDEAAASRLRALPLHVVGERTADAARAHGFSAIETVARDAASLVDALLAGPPAARFLYLAGRDRKPLLEQRLAAAGRAVTTRVVYEAAAAELPPQAVEALRDGGLDAVLHFSRRSAALLIERCRDAGLSDALARLQHVCISADAAAPLRDAGLDARVAATPDADALFAALETV